MCTTPLYTRYFILYTYSRMQFRVPQFIDVEDKIFGPFSFRQFLYLAGGAGAAFVLYKLLPLLIAAPFILFFLGLALALTFYKVNGKPFIHIMEAYFKYLTQHKLYIWKKENKKKDNKNTTNEDKVPLALPRLSESKLKDIAWGLDVLDVKK